MLRYLRIAILSLAVALTLIPNRIALAESEIATPRSAARIILVQNIMDLAEACYKECDKLQEMCERMISDNDEKKRVLVCQTNHTQCILRCTGDIK